MLRLFKFLHEKVIFKVSKRPITGGNLNKLSLKYESYPNSRKIDAFGQKSCFSHNLSKNYDSVFPSNKFVLPSILESLFYGNFMCSDVRSSAAPPGAQLLHRRTGRRPPETAASFLVQRCAPMC